MPLEDMVIHSDLNSFYASVEIMLNPALRGKAVAVCGSTESRHGIVLAKSELAKKAGVKTGMANWEARVACPNLIMVPPQYDQYVKYSRLAHEIYYRYTDLVEPFGMDECWCAFRGREIHAATGEVFRSVIDIAEDIRRSMREELGLTVSVGVAFTKVFAKLASDMKKPDATTIITRNDFRQKVWPLPASDLLYIGHATTAKLARFGIRTIGDVAAMPPDFMKSLLGVNGLKLWSYANGTDASRVCHKDFVSPIKSVGHGITCSTDLHNADEVWLVMLELSQDIGHRLRIHELEANGVQIWIRGNDLYGKQYQCRLEHNTRSPLEIAQAAFQLFVREYPWNTPVRAVTVRAINLVQQGQPLQSSMFWDADKAIRQDALDTAVEGIRSRFGKTAIRACCLLQNLHMPDDGRDQVKMPGLMYQ